MFKRKINHLDAHDLAQQQPQHRHPSPSGRHVGGASMDDDDDVEDDDGD